MRLIDADKLKGEHPVVTFIVDNAPTVDALPIEWLKEWARTHLNRIEEYADIVPDIVSDYREEQRK